MRFAPRAEVALGISHFENKVLWIVDDVLHRHADVDDVFILGQHCLAKLCRSYLRDVDAADRIDTTRVPKETRLRCSVVFAKTEYHRSLLFADLRQAH